MIVNAQHANMLVSPSRTITGKVGLYDGSTLIQTFTGRDAISKIAVNKAGDKKFFGYGVCQELEVGLIDKQRAINVIKDNTLKLSFGVNDEYVSTAPIFYITEVNRDENTNGLTVKAVDAVYRSGSHTLSELSITAPYTIRELTEAIASFLGLELNIINVSDTSFNTSYTEGANFEPSEKLRAVLDDIAEATQTIYYATETQLVFKRLDINGEPVLIIDKANYFTLKSGSDVKLSGVAKATELGDNVAAGDDSGFTQYIRDNGFWELREDIADLVDNALVAVNGLTLNQFSCSWRGNYLLEIGDKISVVTKDNDTITSYFLNDNSTFTGGFSATTSWEYDGSYETSSNPTNLGDKLNQTFARVNKLEKNITLYVGEIAEDIVSEKTAQLTVDMDGIKASVESVEQSVTSSSLNLQEEINELSRRVDASVTDSDVTLQINRALSEGVDRVTTTTGFTFDEQGLKVSKSGSDIESLLDENGLEVSRYDTPVLEARSDGVNALNVNIRQYLQIGGSRIEAYGGRTGCFWIGG